MQVILTTNSIAFLFPRLKAANEAGFVKPLVYFRPLSALYSVYHICLFHAADNFHLVHGFYTHSRYSSKKFVSIMEPAIPMQIEPICRYDFPRMVAAATAASKA